MDADGTYAVPRPLKICEQPHCFVELHILTKKFGLSNETIPINILISTYISRIFLNLIYCSKVCLTE